MFKNFVVFYYSLVYILSAKIYVLSEYIPPSVNSIHITFYHPARTPNIIKLKRAECMDSLSYYCI